MKDPLASAFWLVAVEIPRLVLVFPALMIVLIKVSIHNHFDLHYALESIPWAAFSTLLVLIRWIGFRHMRTRSRIVAWAVIFGLVVEILVLAWAE